MLVPQEYPWTYSFKRKTVLQNSITRQKGYCFVSPKITHIGLNIKRSIVRANKTRYPCITDEVPCGRTVLFLARISLYLDLRDTIFSHSWSRIDNIWAILDNISSFLSSSLVLYLSVQTESVRIILGLQDYTAIGLWRSIYGNYGTRKQSVKKRQRQNLAFVSSFYYFWIMSITAIVWCKTISVYL